MSTLAVRGNGKIILDDIDIYSSNNLPFIEGISLGELVFSNENISFLSMMVARTVSKELDSRNGTLGDPYANTDNGHGAMNNQMEDEHIRRVVIDKLSPIAVRYRFKETKLTRSNFRKLITIVNRKFIAEESKNVADAMVMTVDPVEEEMYKRGQQMLFPWGTDRKKSGFASTGHSYGAKFNSTKLIDNDTRNFDTVIESKVTPHYSYGGPVIDGLISQSVYDKIGKRYSRKK